jgi:hypothetical protein
VKSLPGGADFRVILLLWARLLAATGQLGQLSAQFGEDLVAMPKRGLLVLDSRQQVFVQKT